MLDPDLAKDASALLSTAVAEIVEDVHDLAVRVHVEGEPDPAGVLLQAGQDVTALAAAILVLKRRARTEAEPL